MPEIHGLVATDILLIFYAYFLAHQASNIRSVIKAINGVSVCICSQCTAQICYNPYLHSKKQFPLLNASIFMAYMEHINKGNNKQRAISCHRVEIVMQSYISPSQYFKISYKSEVRVPSVPCYNKFPVEAKAVA